MSISFRLNNDSNLPINREKLENAKNLPKVLPKQTPKDDVCEATNQQASVNLRQVKINSLLFYFCSIRCSI